MSGHIINDFKDLRSLIGEVTKANPAKTTRQQNEKKMGVYKEAPEAKPEDDKKAKALKSRKDHAGEEEIKKAYMKLGRAAQGSVEYQRKLIQKELAKMGYKTYSKYAFDDIFKFENTQLESALSDMQDIVKTKGAKKINGVMVDMFTASVITKAYDKVSDANKKKMEGANLQTLVKLAHKIMGMREELELDESKMGDLLIDIQMGATAKELARDHDISLASAKNFLSDYYGNKRTRKAPGLKKEVKEAFNYTPKEFEAQIKAYKYKNGVKMSEVMKDFEDDWDSAFGNRGFDHDEVENGLKQALKKFRVRFVEGVDEGKMKDIIIDFEDGVSDAKIAKSHGVSVQVIKGLRKDWKSMGEENIQERVGFKKLRQIKSKWKKQIADFQRGKDLDYDAEVDLLAYAYDKGLISTDDADEVDDWLMKNVADKRAFNKLKEENIQEGTWAVPDSKPKLAYLQKIFLSKKIKASEKNARTLLVSIYNIFGDDSFYDDVDKYIDNPDESKDLRDVIISHLSKWGVKVGGYKIKAGPKDWVDSDEEALATMHTKMPFEDIKLEKAVRRGRGNIKKPKGKIVPLTMSKEDKLKEQREHAQQSPFKLKSQVYPRAIAINTDGFGHRHATVEDIITACDSFGMIIDKELQVEQVQKELGKNGFISFKQSDLEEVFEERETQRIILALESAVEEQELIEYTRDQVEDAYIMGEEIEFVKPDGLKTAGKVLKLSGNTYNVKDKFTGKSFTYKYINEEKEVKTFTEVINEGRFPKKLVKQAMGIVWDKRYAGGNMTGAVKAIEKLKKGLSDDPDVSNALRLANEGIDKWIPEGGDKEAYTKFFNKALKKFGVNSPDELEGEKKKEFFNYVDKNWKGDHEEKEVNPSDHKIDGRRKNFKEKMRKLGYIKGN